HPPTPDPYTPSLHDALPICHHQRDDRTVGVAYRFGEPARRPRGVLEDGEVVGACRRGVARALTGDPPEEPVVERNHADAWEEPLDRKSTRLNSSHQIISYAV